MHEHLPHADTKKVEVPLEIKESPAAKLDTFYVIPVAVLVGALLIAGAIIYSASNLAKGLTINSGSTAMQGMQMAPNAPSTPPAAPAAGQKVTVDVGHLPAQGNPNAKVKIIAFEDFRCPFCEKFFTNTEPQIIKDYVDTGKAVLYFRQYQFLGAPSVVAGNAAECANEQGKFWVFHNYLYKNQPSESDTSLFTTDNLTKIAGQLGINTGKFQSCLSSNKYDKNVKDDLAAGQTAGVTGTPTVFVNGIPIVGAQPYSAFKAAIDQQLK
jgi:protein-disulfide isomerase